MKYLITGTVVLVLGLAVIGGLIWSRWRSSRDARDRARNYVRGDLSARDERRLIACLILADKLTLDILTPAHDLTIESTILSDQHRHAINVWRQQYVATKATLDSAGKTSIK